MENELWINRPIDEVVLHYAQNAQKAGLDGVVCSPLEAGKVHGSLRRTSFLTVTPGVRFADDAKGDQSARNDACFRPQQIRFGLHCCSGGPLPLLRILLAAYRPLRA